MIWNSSPQVVNDPADGGTADWSRYADNRFHMLMLQATGNPLLVVVARPIFSVLRDRFLRDKAEPTFWPQVATEHAEILDCVRPGNAAAVTRAMRNHLANLRDT